MLSFWIGIICRLFGRRPTVKAEDAVIRNGMYRTGREDLGPLMLLNTEGIPEIIQGGKYLGNIRCYLFIAFDGTPIQVTREVVDELIAFPLWSVKHQDDELFDHARAFARMYFDSMAPEYREELRAAHEERAAEVGLRPRVREAQRHMPWEQAPQSPAEAPEAPAPIPLPHQPGKRRMRTGRK